MEKIVISGEFFNVHDTLSCGQIFRFKPYLQGYKVFSKDKCAYVYNDGEFAIITCEKGDVSYFKNFFDLQKDYSKIFNMALNSNSQILRRSSILAKGIRILNQDATETLFSFMISQNNNIPRIKKSIEGICENYGEKKIFLGEEYYTFPNFKMLVNANENALTKLGLGYRAKYIISLIKKLNDGYDLDRLRGLATEQLKGELTKIYGVGPKVADCVSFFGFNKTDSFPVDTWIEKVYLEDFNGDLTSREKMAKYFVEMYGKNAGYFQQYLFYYKRSLQKKDKE